MTKSNYEKKHSVNLEREDANNMLELHPQLVIVRTTEISDQAALGNMIIRIECYSEVSNESFDIIALPDSVLGGNQHRFKFIRRFFEEISGWRVRFFRFNAPVDSGIHVMIERGKRLLYINADVLRMPFLSIMKLFRRLPELLETLTARLKLTIDEFGSPNEAATLRVNQQASVGLTVAESGLSFPSCYVFSANELFVHVSINGNEIYLRFDNGWRMFYQSDVTLPFYAYKTPIEVKERGYTIPFPVEVCFELSMKQRELYFKVHTS